MASLISSYKFMGKHRHLRRMRKPWFKLEFAILWRLSIVFIIMLPCIITYLVLYGLKTAITYIEEEYGNIFNVLSEYLTNLLGADNLEQREKAISARVYNWRRRMGVGYPTILKKEEEYPPNADQIFLRDTIDKLEQEKSNEV